LRPDLGKQFQLTVVVVGFFTTLQLLIVQEWTRPVILGRVVVTLAFSLACAIRYWWVILLLAWPARWFRTLLLLLAWSALPVTAVMVGNVVRWGLALAVLSAVGCITEIYNFITRQWSVGSAEVSASLKSVHVIGAAAAGGAAVILAGAIVFLPSWLDVIIPVLVIVDFARLIMMIQRHQRLIEVGLLP